VIKAKVEKHIHDAVSSSIGLGKEKADELEAAQKRVSFMSIREYFATEDWSGVFDEDEVAPWMDGKFTW